MRVSNSGHMKLALLYLYLSTVMVHGNCLYVSHRRRMDVWCAVEGVIRISLIEGLLVGGGARAEKEQQEETGKR